MSRARDPYNDALTALAAFAGAGRFGWGEPLVATALAGELHLSPTPVREALARLAGEGLIEHRPGRGYYAPSPTVDDVVDLYEMHRLLIHWAIDRLERVTVQRPVTVPSADDESVFGGLVRASGGPVLVRAQWRITLQLRPIRVIEDQIAPVDPDWRETAASHVLAGDYAALRQEVDRYHAARAMSSSAVTEVMRQSDQSIARI